MRYSSNIIASLSAIILSCSMKGTHAGFPTSSEEEVLALSQEMVTTSVVEPNKVLIKYKNEEGRAAAIAASVDNKVEVDLPNRNTVSIIIPGAEALIPLENHPQIERIEYDREVHTLVYSREPIMMDHDHRRLAEDTPWGITAVNLGGIPPVPSNGFEPKVCVIDTGYHLSHSDLPKASDGVAGYSPYGGNQLWNVDGDGHGTHCAGTIGAVGGNNLGVTSVNPDKDSFTFFIGKGLTNGGTGSDGNIALAIDRCVSEGANIISMSLGGGSPSNTIGDACEDAYNANVLVIAAAGNDGNSGKGWPASHPEVMSVAATNINSQRASFSQFNDQVEIAAPGVDVRSTTPSNGYSVYSGTSMATPHVAGVAARVWAHFPQCSNHQIRTVLIRTAQNGSGQNGNCDTRFGHGIVDATAAYDLLNTYGCEAGGDNPAGARSNGAVGGCAQPIPPLPPLGPPPPTPAPVTSAPTTAGPTTSPVAPEPTAAPVTEAPQPPPSGNCAAGFHELEFYVTTDWWPEETKLQVRRGSSRLVTLLFDDWWTSYYYTECFEATGGNYKIRLIDEFSDRIDSPGGWEIFWNGQLVYEGRGPNFGKRRLDVDVED